MTPPPAATAAARSRAGMRPASSSRVGAHPRSRRPAARRPARRVSGPARPAPAARRAPAPRAAAPRPAARAAQPSLGSRLAGAATAAAAVALPQPQRTPAPRPRPRPVARPVRRPDLSLGARALNWLRGLPDHRLLHRLIGGRVWIVLIGGLLVGIVTMQLTLLRLNAGIGEAVRQTATLEQRNAELRLAISRLSDSARIAALGAQMGLVTPPQGSPRFLRAGDGDAARALATMRVPNAVPAAIPTAADTTVTDPSTVDPATGAPVDPAAATTDSATTDPAATTTTTTTPAASTTDPATTDPAVATATTDTAAVAPPSAAGGAAPPTTGQE